jgi:lactate dehydrogenase-like 2-hydroxyacid dehydrogenase
MITSFRVLIVDLLGLAFDDEGQPSPQEIADYIAEKGGRFHFGSAQDHADLAAGTVHFFYCPNLSTEAEILAEATHGYDAVIAAATIIPVEAEFPFGGVRIGAGTGNMRSKSWGGGSGRDGSAPLMNTPGINSRATAQMVFKAILQMRPDLPFGDLHDRVVAGAFDTGRDLRCYPTRKLETHRLAVIGFGNIGREVARLGQAFGMEVVVHARSRHAEWIEASGFEYAPTIVDAARGADIVSVHLGLGPQDENGRFANAGFLNSEVLSALNDGAMLVNFDRGEVVDIAALREALASGKMADVAVDADIFVTASQVPTGPLAPYLPLQEEFGNLLLLPHAVADTDHPSRVDGAKQAVDQIMDVVQHRRVANLVGDCPEGFVSVGRSGNPDILGPDPVQLAGLAGSPDLSELQLELSVLQGFLTALDAGMADDAYRGVLAATRVRTLLDKLSLVGPIA